MKADPLHFMFLWNSIAITNKNSLVQDFELTMVTAQDQTRAAGFADQHASFILWNLALDSAETV